MEILRAIERADELCPNPYTFEEKLSWCDEVTAEIRRNIIKIYDVIETPVSSHGDLNLPDDIPYERVEIAYINGYRLEKQDLRSFISGARDIRPAAGCGGKLSIVYLSVPKPIRYPDIRGEFNTGTNYIEMTAPPFIEGDSIEIAELSKTDEEPAWENTQTAYILETADDKIILDRDLLEPQTLANLAIRRIVDDVTAVDEPPYDGMYIEYILAKAALYQHDYVGYNAHMTQYNSLYEALRREVNSRGPQTQMSRFRNYTCV